MVAGCPLTVSDLPYDKDLFENTCVKTTLRDAKFLAEFIEKTIETPYEFNQKGKDAVSKFGNRLVEMRNLEKLYRSL